MRRERKAQGPLLFREVAGLPNGDEVPPYGGPQGEEEKDVFSFFTRAGEATRAKSRNVQSICLRIIILES